MSIEDVHDEINSNPTTPISKMSVRSLSIRFASLMYSSRRRIEQELFPDHADHLASLPPDDRHRQFMLKVVEFRCFTKLDKLISSFE